MNSIRTRDGRGRRRLSFSKALPVYNTEEEMLRNEKIQSDQVINTNMADLIAQSRAYIAVPTDQKDESKAKKDDSANNKKSANDSKDSKEQHREESKSETTTTAPISPPSEEANKTSSTKADAEKEKAAAAPPAKKPVVAPKLATLNPNCTVKFAYKPMEKITAAPFYLKYKPPVVPTEHNFDWNQVHYEITEKDIKFMKQAGLQITNQQFEKVIDIFEKLAVSGKDQSLRTLSEKFYEHVDIHYQDAITKDHLQQIYMQYWKPERENRKVKSFLRCFWENPEYNDQDPFSAFRNLKKEEKIKTRFNLKKAEDRYKKCSMIKEQSYQVIDMLPKIWNREAVKKALDVAHDAEFDLRYEAMCKEKGIANKQPVAKYDIKALQAPQNSSENLKLLIKPPPRAEAFKPPVSPHNNKKPPVPQQNQKQIGGSKLNQRSVVDEQAVESKGNKKKGVNVANTRRNPTDNEASVTTADMLASETEQPSKPNPEDNLSEPSLVTAGTKKKKASQKNKPEPIVNINVPPKAGVPEKTKKPADVQMSNTPTIQEPSVPEEKKDWTHCSFDMISMFTRMMSEMKKNEIDLSQQSFIQDKRYNLEELKQKASSIIQQVDINNQNDSTKSTITQPDSSSSKEVASKSQNAKSSPSKKSGAAKNRASRQQQRLLIRRGRNNMVYVRPILENVFDDSDDQHNSEDDSTNEDSANDEETKTENNNNNGSNNKQQQNHQKQLKQRSSGMFMRRLKKYMRKKKIYTDCKNGAGAWNNNGFGFDGSNHHQKQFQTSANGDSNQQQEDEQPVTKLSYSILKDVQSSVQKQFLLDIVNDQSKPSNSTKQSLMYCSLETALVREESVSVQEREQIIADSKSFGEKFKQFQGRNMLGSGKGKNRYQQSGGKLSSNTNVAAMKNTLLTGANGNTNNLNGTNNINGNNGHHYQQSNGGVLPSASSTTIRFSLPTSNGNTGI